MEKANRYEWFRGPQKDQDKKAQIKKTGKVIWKFSKIFGIFSILFLSLWGCGQSFAIRQDSHVGKSLEIYKDESSIPPHITQFQANDLDTGIQGAEKLYSLKQNDSNIWLAAQPGGKALQGSVQKEINKQGHKMSDAYRGVNEAVQLVDQNGKIASGQKAILVDNNGTPLVMTSKITDKNASFSISSNEYTTNLLDSNKVQTKINIIDNLLNTVYYTPVDWANPTALTDTNWTPQEKNYMVFKSALFAQLGKYNNGANNWIIDALTLQGDYAIPEGAKIEGPLVQKFDAIVKAQSAAINTLSYLGFNMKGSVATYKLQVDLKSMPGDYGTTYRPIVTWGQAWERGFGPFYGLVVYPIAQVLVRMLDSMPSMSGWEALISIVVIVVVLRILAFLISFKSTMQQTRMQELGLKKATIDAKYAAYKDNKQMQMRKNQEIQEMYRKEGVNPLSAITAAFITMPIFLAMWRMISALPHLKSTVWLSINFSATSYKELFSGEVQYLPLLLVALSLSLFSSFYGRLLVKKRERLRGNAHLKTAMKKTDRTQIIITIVFAFISVIFTAGIQIYSIIVSLWMIFQTHLTHYLLIRKSKKKKDKDLGIERPSHICNFINSFKKVFINRHKEDNDKDAKIS